MSTAIQPLSVHSFVLKIPDIDTVGFFMHCSGLELGFDVLEYHEGGNNDFVHRCPAACTTRTSCSSAASPTRTCCSSGSRDPHARPSARRSRSRSTRRRAREPHVHVRRRVPGRVDRARRSTAAEPSVATETLEIAHGGLKMDADDGRSRRASRRRSSRSTARTRSSARSTRRATRSRRRTCGHYKPDHGRRPPRRASSAAACRRRYELVAAARRLAAGPGPDASRTPPTSCSR